MVTKTAPAPLPHHLSKYFFEKMEKGDSFEIEDQTEDGAVRVRNASLQFRIRGKKKTWKFSTRKRSDGKFWCTRTK